MKALKVLTVVLLATFVYSAANAQHRVHHYKKHHVMRHPHRHRK